MGGGAALYFRPTWRQILGRALFAGTLVAGAAALVLGGKAVARTADPTDLLWLPAAFALGALCVMPASYFSGVSVDETGVHPIVLGRAASRYAGGYAAWSRITDIRCERRGTRTVPVVHLATGHALRLQAPYSGRLLAADPRFDEKVFMLRNVWEIYRSWLTEPDTTGT